MSIDPQAMTILVSTPQVLKAMLADALPGAVDLATDGEWSARQALAHLVDTEQGVLAERVRRMVEEDRPFIRSIDAPARLVKGGYTARDVASLLREFRELRERHVPWLGSLSDGQLSRSGDHDAAGEITASDVAHQWAYHDLMHVRQIAAALQAPLVDHMGNTRRFYDI